MKLATVLLTILLANPLTSEHERADLAPQNTILVPTLGIEVKGRLGSHIRVRFPATPGKKFSVPLESPGGERVEARGLLRIRKQRGYALRLELSETNAGGEVKKRSFTTNLTLGKEKTVCRGWVWWYEVKLTVAK